VAGEGRGDENLYDRIVELFQDVCYDDGAFVIPAGQVMVREADYKTLRDERDRLRKALEDIRDSIGNGALNVNWIKQYAEAALTPARGGKNEK